MLDFRMDPLGLVAGKFLLKKTQSHVVAVCISMLLVESQWTPTGKEVAKHAGEDAAIIIIELAGSILTTAYQLPFSAFGKRALFLVLVFVEKVVPNISQIFVSSSALAVVKFDALFLH